jgi:CheY-like chemotaxis protein
VKYTPYNLRVLIVDPNTHIRQLLRMMLQSDGAKTIYGSNNAVDGFDAYCGNEFNVVFTEFDMEPISGLDFAELIRKAPKSPNPYVPIIMLSAYSDVQRVERARDHGVTEFIAKPFSFGTVVERIKAVFEAPRQFVRTSSYFGPDRRRAKLYDYSGPERRKSRLTQVTLTKNDLAKRQRQVLTRNRQASMSR